VTRWLITGADGMLGTELVQLLGDHEVTAATLETLDITDPAAVEQAVPGHDVVVNCAAWTAVDDAETHEAQAFAVNAIGAAHLARACARSGAWMLQLSTDYVFAGDAITPYAEDDAVAPRSAYGRTKAAGESAVGRYLPERSWLVRTAWLYGRNGPNFVSTMARLERERETVDVVDDQRGQPTWTRDLATQLIRLVEAGAPAGIYHGTASGETTWYHLARRVFELLGADPDRVRPGGSEAFPRPAPRPAYSVLGHRRWVEVGLEPLREWDVALTDAAQSLGISPPTVPASMGTWPGSLPNSSR
jgi:dTDP-4-dehydrorhamnose reductase